MTNSTDLKTAQDFVHGSGIVQQLRQRAAELPDHVYGVEGEHLVTLAELDQRVRAASGRLDELGVTEGSRVAVALPTTVQHAVLVLAVFHIGALWVPVNPQLRGEPLKHQVEDAQVTHFLISTEGPFPAAVQEAAGPLRRRTVESGIICLNREQPGQPDRPEGVALLMYTSGTTGPPKGVQVTSTMLRAAVLGTLDVTEAQQGDVLYLWEPLFHIGGAQTMLLPLYRNITLAFAPRFSASRFWSDVRRHGVTHIHYLGGVLQVLLQLPPTADERASRVRIAWGAGATPNLWEASRDRFGFAIHECYGMTETSSIVTVNRNDSDGGVGQTLPWFEVEIRPHTDGTARQASGKGEIAVRGSMEGLITPGYLNRPEATAKAWRDGWFDTGDLGRFDDRGALHFAGRANDSIRVRGENVSAWQVEEIFNQHPDVARSAVSGVAAEIGEQEMMLFVLPEQGRSVEPTNLLDWAQSHLAGYQMPRYVKTVAELPLTPSQRIAKYKLPRSTGEAFDARAERRT